MALGCANSAPVPLTPNLERPPMRIVAIDLFVVPTASFQPLYGLLIVGLGRRQILWLGVTGFYCNFARKS